MGEKFCGLLIRHCMQGFSWSGFETGATMVDGLWSNYANPKNRTLSGDFATSVYLQQALGFNAVRLPFRSTISLVSMFQDV